MREAGAQPGHRLLLLEDEPMILMDLEDAARDAGHDAVVASTCNEAIELIAAQERIDVAVLDFRLEGGRTCTSVARTLQSRGIPYVLHSADLDRGEAVAQLGGDLWVAKPAVAGTVIEAAVSLIGSQGGGALAQAAE